MKFLIIVAFFAFAAAQDRDYPIFDRTCDARKAAIRPFVKSSFNVAAYAGQWFEIERYQQRDEIEADCLSNRYTWGFISRSFLINRDGFDFVINIPHNREATGFLAHPNDNPILGLLNVTYSQDIGLYSFFILIFYNYFIFVLQQLIAQTITLSQPIISSSLWDGPARISQVINPENLLGSYREHLNFQMIRNCWRESKATSIVI